MPPVHDGHAGQVTTETVSRDRLALVPASCSLSTLLELGVGKRDADIDGGGDDDGERGGGRCDCWGLENDKEGKVLFVVLFLPSMA